MLKWMLGCATWAQLEAESSCIGHMRTKCRRVVDFEEFNCNALELQLTLNLSAAASNDEAHAGRTWKDVRWIN